MVHFQLTFSNGRELQGRENEAPKNTVGNSLEERKSPLFLNSFHHSSFAYQYLFFFFFFLLDLSSLAWRIPWTEKTGGLQSMGS